MPEASATDNFYLVAVLGHRTGYLVGYHELERVTRGRALLGLACCLVCFRRLTNLG